MVSAVRVASPTEGRNPRTLEIDTLPTLEVLELLNDEDARVAPAVRAVLPELARAVDAAVERYRAGGTIHYFGAGTSGRLATLDAAELPPTFSADPARTVAHHAGGAAALVQAAENVEDRPAAGREAAATVTSRDVAVGVAASGRTPFVIGALEAAREAGAFTVFVSSAPPGPATEFVDVYLFVDTGPEAIAGSTRLKAGTAQKLVLNSFSTALMIRLGKTYSNLMVDVTRHNAKLRGRVEVIVEEATGADADACRRALDEAGGDTKTAIVSLLADTDATTARAALEATDRRVRDALVVLRASPDQSTATIDEVPMEQ
ncbi:MAG: N-acetylmuramic acid 6-phosphate etherase [Candidatus Limnocylindrales bacterium]